MGDRKRKKATWDATSVRSLRRHLGLTQQQLSDELGVRQQTVSEWETGLYRPRGPSAALLTLISERCGFNYKVANSEAPDSVVNPDPLARWY